MSSSSTCEAGGPGEKVSRHTHHGDDSCNSHRIARQSGWAAGLGPRVRHGSALQRLMTWSVSSCSHAGPTTPHGAKASTRPRGCRQAGLPWTGACAGQQGTGLSRHRAGSPLSGGSAGHWNNNTRAAKQSGRMRTKATHSAHCTRNMARARALRRTHTRGVLNKGCTGVLFLQTRRVARGQAPPSHTAVAALGRLGQRCARTALSSR
jgi:hypothetical protein